MCNRLDSIPACDRRTDRRRQTDILPRHSPRYAYASRGKNRGYVYAFWRQTDKQTSSWIEPMRKGALASRQQRINDLDAYASTPRAVNLSIKKVA